MTLLSLTGLRAGYGGSDIVHGVSLQVSAGETVALVGPNGAGKSTLLKAAAGLATVTGGSINLNGRDITRLSPLARAGAGAAFLPQDRNVFRTLSVAENLAISAPSRRDAVKRREEVIDLLPALVDLLERPAGRLSGGQRQIVALGMALMSRPSLLLADEPTAGLAPQLVARMLDQLRGLAVDASLGVLIVEQNARAALDRADRALVLVDGRVARQGPAAQLAAEPDFGRIFFGEAA